MPIHPDLRFLSFVPLTPELTMYFCSTAWYLTAAAYVLRTYMHMVPAFIRT